MIELIEAANAANAGIDYPNVYTYCGRTGLVMISYWDAFIQQRRLDILGCDDAQITHAETAAYEALDRLNNGGTL
jgi:hypothetical protein